MACAGLFGYADGAERMVGHDRLRPRDAVASAFAVGGPLLGGITAAGEADLTARVVS